MLGTYVRQHSIDLLLEAFLKNGGRQVVSLGGGSDTRPFNLLQRAEFSSTIVIHELDFQVSTARKVSTIKANKQLHHVIPVKSTDESEIHTTNYHLHAKDLRELNASSPLLPGMDPSLPTLVLSECCLCYLEPGESDGVMDWLVKNFQTGLGMILYEPIGGNDQFGVVMKENLAMRGISLPTLNKYPTLLSQTNRLQAWGFTALSRAADMDYIHNNWLDDEDKQRIDNLEFLDEREELDLLLKHYCVAWAVTRNTSFHDAWLAFKSNS